MATKEDGMTKVVWCTLVVFFLCKLHVTDATCNGSQVNITSPNGTEEVCCDTCKPGNGAKVACSSDNNTVCEACISGKTYQTEVTYNSTCKQCATCGNDSTFVIHPCNVTHNTVCQCSDGYYYDVEADKCKLCNLCPAGWGATRRCTRMHDAICSPCESNVTFSDKLDHASPCSLCTICTEKEVTLQQCKANEDTICFSRDAGGKTPNIFKYSTPTVYKQNDEDEGDIIPVYCAALGLVVVGLLGYVIFKHWSRLRAKRRQKSPCSHEDVEYSKASGADSGVFVDSDTPKNYTYCLASRARDLPQAKRKELEKILSSPLSDGWKALGKELGYNNRRLEQFETRRKGENNGFKHMFNDWERRNLSSVNHLIQCLRNIGRDDAARIVYLDSTEGRTQTMAKHSNMV